MTTYEVIVSDEGGTTYARTAAGATIASGDTTAAAAVLTAAISHMVANSLTELQIAPGTYGDPAWGVALPASAPLHVWGAGATLQATDEHVDQFFIVRASGQWIDGIALDGNGATVDKGIAAAGANMAADVTDLRFTNLTATGIDNAGIAVGNKGVIFISASTAGGGRAITDVTITGGTITASGKGVSVNASNGTIDTVLVDGLTVTDCTSTGILLTGADDTEITGCTANGNGEHGICCHYGARNTVTGCTANGNTLAGIAIGTESTYPTVTGNSCDGNGWHGITVDPGLEGLETWDTYAEIHDNICTNSTTYHGIYFQRANHCTATGNTCTGNAHSGIMLNGSDGTLTGNTITGNTTADVYLAVEANDHAIEGNTFCRITHAVTGLTGTIQGNFLPPFTVSIAAPVTGEAVAFTGPCPAIVAASWDFGDGSGSAAQHPTHAYPTAGVYPVTLAAGGNTVLATVTVLPGVSYGGARLSEADLAPLDHDPTCNATDLQNGRVGLQGSPVSRKAWTINALADDRAEIEALAALKGQHLILNINGTEYPGTMIRPPLLETQLAPGAWAYQVGFVQETRR